LLKSTSQMSTSTVDAAQNPVEVDAVIRDFCEETVKRAAELAQSTNLSAEEILEESKLLMAPVASRLKRRRKVSAWDIAMREGKHTIDAAIVKPVAGTGPSGRPAFNGQYLREVQKIYDDPVKREEYERMAKDENEKEQEVAMESLPAKQKQLLKEIRQLVSETHLCYASAPCRILLIIDSRRRRPEIRKSTSLSWLSRPAPMSMDSLPEVLALGKRSMIYLPKEKVHTRSL
jgi:hypothetical protein